MSRMPRMFRIPRMSWMPGWYEYSYSIPRISRTSRMSRIPRMPLMHRMTKMPGCQGCSRFLGCQGCLCCLGWPDNKDALDAWYICMYMPPRMSRSEGYTVKVSRISLQEFIFFHESAYANKSTLESKSNLGLLIHKWMCFLKVLLYI
jgi:hypothetical protein